MAKSYLLHHLLQDAVEATPTAEAVVDLIGARRSFDYQSIFGMASRCAAALQSQGLQKGDRVAIYLPKGAEEAAAIFAATMADGVFVSVNALLLGHQVSHILADCGVNHLITSTRDWERVRGDVVNVESLRGLLFIDQNSDVQSGSLPSLFNILQNGSDAHRASSSIGDRKSTR